MTGRPGPGGPPEPWAAVRRLVAGVSRASVPLLFLVALGLRIAVARLPSLAETNYEEAGVGLMARHVLAGEHIALWWGVPYLGTLEVYLTALLFGLLPATTFVLRLVPLLLSLTAALFAYLLARELFGRAWAAVVLAWWVLPPAYLMRLGVTPYNYIGAVAYGNVILYLTHRALSREPASPRIWYGIGLFWGLALWNHLIGLAYIGASGLAVLVHGVARERRASLRAWLGHALLQPAYLRCAAGLIVGSLPFWWWNLRHGFETFRAMVAVAREEELAMRVKFVTLTLLVEALGRAESFWTNPAAARFLTSAVLALYGSLLLYLIVVGVGRAGGGGGPASRAAGAPAGLLLLVATALLAWGQVVVSAYHQPRYLMPVYSAAPLLLVAWARGLARWRAWAAAPVVAGFLLIHVVDNAQLVEASRPFRRDPRPIDAVIRFLDTHGISHAYAHFRVAWPLGFESGERLIASDWYGYRTNRYYPRGVPRVYMEPYFRAMEAVDLAPRVALVTDESLGIPTAHDLAATLRLLGGTYRTARLGPYTVFYDWEPPAGRLREIPEDRIRLRAMPEGEQASQALDRNMFTQWRSNRAQETGMFVEAVLDRPRRVARIVLDPGHSLKDYPRGVRVEVVRADGRWDEVLAAPQILGGVDWMHGHPKLNLKGRVAIWLAPVETARIRLTRIGPLRDAHQWRITELYLYETAGPAQTDAPARLARDPAALVEAIVASGVEAVYGSDETNALLTRELPEAIRTVTLREGRFTHLDDSERVVRPERRNGFLVDEPSPPLEADLDRHGLAWRAAPVPGGLLYVAAPRPEGAPLYWAENRLLAMAFRP